MEKNKSTIQSIWDMNCPRCRKGDLFETSTFSFQKPFDMPKNCNKCNQRYEPEPGFYYGAMYISYALSGGFSLCFLALMILGFGFSIGTSFAFLIPILAIAYVWVYRISRSLYVHARVKFNEKISKEING